MRSILTFILAFCSFFSLHAPQAEAFSLSVDERIRITEDSAEDLYLLGDVVTIGGAVEGDVMSLANSLSILQPVSDDLFAAGSTIEISNSIAGDVLVLAEHLVIDRGAVISGNLVAIASRITLDGTIEGDATLTVDNFSMDSLARINGALSYNLHTENPRYASQVLGGISTYDTELFSDKSKRAISDTFTALHFYRFLSLFALTLLVVYGARRLLSDVYGTIQQAPFRTGLLGGGVMLFGWMPSLLIFVFSTPLALWSFTTWVFIALFMSKLFISSFASHFILSRFALSPTWMHIGIIFLSTLGVSLLFLSPVLHFLLIVCVYLPILGGFSIVWHNLLGSYLSGKIKL